MRRNDFLDGIEFSFSLSNQFATIVIQTAAYFFSRHNLLTKMVTNFTSNVRSFLNDLTSINVNQLTLNHVDSFNKRIVSAFQF
ncbi:hypothetical protein D3C80_1283080 [compost metagenome]